MGVLKKLAFVLATTVVLAVLAVFGMMLSALWMIAQFVVSALGVAGITGILLKALFLDQAKGKNSQK